MIIMTNCQRNRISLLTFILLPVPHIVCLARQVPPNAPVITGYSQDSAITVGEELTLTCTVKGGNPVAQVFWLRNEEFVDFSYTIDGDEAINQLTITVGYRDNNARFTCRAYSDTLLVPMEVSITLNVYFSPELVNITGYSHAVRVGDQVTLTCTTGPSNPPASISWWSAGRQIKSHGDHVVEAPNGGFITSQQLTIVTADTDEVTYTCQVTNEQLLRSVSASTTISIQSPPNKPFISGFEPGQVVKPNDVLRMTCVSVGGSPPANLTWTKNGVTIQNADYAACGSIVTSEISIITDTTDSGAIYTCYASNPALPEPLSTNVRLVMYYAPKIEKTPRKAKVASSVGRRASIVCAAEGAPIVYFGWYRDGNEINIYSGRYMIDIYQRGDALYESRLTIANVNEEDFGTFECRAYNGLGSDNWDITLGSESVPDPVTDLRAEGKTDTTITLSWTPGFDGGASQSFHVKYNIHGSDDYLVSSVMPSDDNMFVVTGLSPNTTYHFTVRASNALGYGPYGANSLTATTESSQQTN
ncbi:nephrin-like [Ptychodera flava]|uniref:nephrin-like n=1 Tax=Ptychodera flava TaxID=63121 RepID=UPI00396A2595